MLKALIVLSVFFSTACLARAEGGSSGFDRPAWEAWRDKEYRHFRETLFANPFTLQDTTELKPGETVYLALPKAPQSPRWVKEKPIGDHAELKFDGQALAIAAGTFRKDNFIKDSWTAPNGLGIAAGSLRAGKVKVLVYSLKENKFTPALMPYFPFAGAAVVRAKLDRTKKNERAKITTTQGDTRDYPIVGELRFTLNGKEQALQAYRADPKKPRELFIPFKDKTSGRETYGGGRYVEAELESDETEEVTIDFNRAYQPYCLYSPHFNCPVVMGNRLEGELKAGAFVPGSLRH